MVRAPLSARTAWSTSDRDLPVSAPVRCRPTPADAVLQFPGCRPVRIPGNRIEDFEGRLEYWGAHRDRLDHRLAGDRYEVVAESAAFPGWTAPEIHVALTEPLTTEHTCRVLERVGRALGAREGTGPQDDPLLRVLGDRERIAGRAEGRTAGRAEGQAELVRAMLVERGIAVSESFTARTAAAVDTPRGARMAGAARACTDEKGFWRRLDQP